MTSGADQISAFVGGFSWQEGLRAALMSGQTPRQIAAVAGVSTRTVERQRAAIGMAPRGGRQTRGGGGAGRSSAATRAVAAATRAAAAAAAVSKPFMVAVELDIEYTRGGKRTFEGRIPAQPALALALQRGDTDKAGQLLNTAIATAYRLPNDLPFSYVELDLLT